jgi:DnaK suppressor protein
MSSDLTPGQRSLLETTLRLRHEELERLLKDQQGGLSRVEHARELLTVDSDDVKHREAARELDLQRAERARSELSEVGAALGRMQDGDYGQCEDCDAAIAYDRLKIEPWARRCIACESRREREAQARR